MPDLMNWASLLTDMLKSQKYNGYIRSITFEYALVVPFNKAQLACIAPSDLVRGLIIEFCETSNKQRHLCAKVQKCLLGICDLK